MQPETAVHRDTRFHFLTTAEVADYLRLKERKVYELVRQDAIPYTRVTGKLLFPRESIDLWVMNHLAGDERVARPLPAVAAGSHDPLLDWSLRESGADLATLFHGSGDGVRRLLEDGAMLAGLHLRDSDSGGYNEPASLGLGGMRDLVVIHWAWRRQGLVVQRDNPHGVQGLADLAATGVRVAQRQPEAGAEALFRWLLAAAGIEREHLQLMPHPCRSEDDLALAVSNGEADAGLAIEASARRHGLVFIPLHSERFDLAMRRRSYFEAPVQALMAFVRTARFRERAEAMGGYDISDTGRVLYNA